jgi:hypothetical protein
VTLPALRYVVGEWESLWPSKPFLKHRFLVDTQAATVVAGDERVNRRWARMTVEDLEYMQQILQETFSDFFSEPEGYGFRFTETLPAWATEPSNWPRADQKNGGGN